MTTPTKRCAKCHETKPVDAFHKRREAADGLQSSCKACMTAYQRDYDSKRSEVGELRVGVDRAVELLRLECEQSVVRVRRAAEQVVEEVVKVRGLK